MTPESIAAWLDELYQCCAAQPATSLYLIIDQALDAAPLAPGISSFVSCHSLFTGLPEEDAVHLAPLLIQVDRNSPLVRLWLSSLMAERDPRTCMVALVSKWNLQALGAYLSRCLEASNGGQTGILRFYDPRLFPLLFSHVLTPAQQQPLLSPAVSWNWLDRDGLRQQMEGLDEPPMYSDELVPPELTDTQMETLACASDAAVLTQDQLAAFPADHSLEYRFQTCYAAMLEATRIGLILPTQRDAFALDLLHKRGGV